MPPVYPCCIKRSTRKQGGSCPSRHYSAAEIEQAIIKHYRTIRLRPEVRERIWADVRRDAEERSAVVVRDIERHQRKIKKLEDNQASLVQLSYKGLVTDEVLASEQHRLEDEKQQVQRMLDTAQLHARDIEVTLDGALDKTQTPYATYLASSPLERRLLNQTFFERILVGEDAVIEETQLTPVYSALSAWEPCLGQPTASRRTIRRQEGACANPDPVSLGRGSHKTEIVDPTGLRQHPRDRVQALRQALAEHS